MRTTSSPNDANLARLRRIQEEAQRAAGASGELASGATTTEQNVVVARDGFEATAETPPSQLKREEALAYTVAVAALKSERKMSDAEAHRTVGADERVAMWVASAADQLGSGKSTGQIETDLLRLLKSDNTLGAKGAVIGGTPNPNVVTSPSLWGKDSVRETPAPVAGDAQNAQMQAKVAKVEQARAEATALLEKLNGSEELPEGASKKEIKEAKKKQFEALDQHADVVHAPVFMSYALRGDAPRSLSGTDLENEIGVAMNLQPNVKNPKDGDVLFEGETAKAIGPVADQIRKLHGNDGTPPKVTALPIVVNTEEDGITQLPLFRVETKKGERFVDNTGRSYESFDDWKKNNKLPEGRVTYPVDGHLTEGPDGKPKTETANTAVVKDTAWEHIRDAGDKVALVGGIALLGAVLAPVAVPAAALLGAGTLLGGWSLFRSGSNLKNRADHGETVNPLKSGEARLDWLAVGASTLSLGTIGGTVAFARTAASGASAAAGTNTVAAAGSTTTAAAAGSTTTAAAAGSTTTAAAAGSTTTAAAAGSTSTAAAASTTGAARAAEMAPTLAKASVAAQVADTAAGVDGLQMVLRNWEQIPEDKRLLTLAQSVFFFGAVGVQAKQVGGVKNLYSVKAYEQSLLKGLGQTDTPSASRDAAATRAARSTDESNATTTPRGSVGPEVDPAKLTSFLQEQRWFQGKGRPVENVAISDRTSLGTSADGKDISLTTVDVRYKDGTVEHYFAPLKIGPNGSVTDAVTDPTVARKLFRMATDPDAAGTGAIRGERTSAGEEILPQLGNMPKARVLNANSSNTLVALEGQNGKKVMMKVVRRVEPGVSPEKEMGSFLAENGFKNTPALLASADLDGNVKGTGIYVHDFVDGLVDDGFGYLKTKIAALPPGRAIPDSMLNEIRDLGRVTGEMHAVLGSGKGNADMAAEPLTRGHLDSLKTTLRAELDDALSVAGDKSPELAARRADLERMIDRLDKIEPSGLATRIHGDYHLGQVLRTEEGKWVLTDFEGEPARTLPERREKAPPMRDVAGMLRSFDYLADATGGGPSQAKEMRERFMAGYLDATGGRKAPANQRADTRALLDATELQKTLYELKYELRNRPENAHIPLRRLNELADAGAKLTPYAGPAKPVQPGSVQRRSTGPVAAKDPVAPAIASRSPSRPDPLPLDVNQIERRLMGQKWLTDMRPGKNTNPTIIGLERIEVPNAPAGTKYVSARVQWADGVQQNVHLSVKKDGIHHAFAGANAQDVISAMVARDRAKADVVPATKPAAAELPPLDSARLTQHLRKETWLDVTPEQLAGLKVLDQQELTVAGTPAGTRNVLATVELGDGEHRVVPLRLGKDGSIADGLRNPDGTPNNAVIRALDQGADAAAAPVAPAAGRIGSPVESLRSKVSSIRDNLRAAGSRITALRATRAASEAVVPVDVRKPFDAKAEASALEAALDGADNHWSVVRRYTSPEDRKLFATNMRKELAALSPQHADDLFVRSYAKLIEVRGGQDKNVQRYLKNLKDPVERGPIFHGYVDGISVPAGKEAGTFNDVTGALPMIQGRPEARTAIGRGAQNVRDRIAANPMVENIVNRVGIGPRRDEGLGFKRLMLTPFHKEDGLDGGYSQIDPTKVDPRLGGDAEHARLQSAAVKRNVEVLADRIPNHNSRLHERTQALLSGDLSRLEEHINWSGAAKVGEIQKDGQKWNVIVHAGEDVGAVSTAWAIFPDSNPDNLVRVKIPVLGKYQDPAKLREVMGDSFALDDTAKAQVKELFERSRMPEPGADGRRFLGDSAKQELRKIRDANNERAIAKVTETLARGETPEIEVDLFMSFMGNIQYDKNLAHPAVFQEELDAVGLAMTMGQTGMRKDAVIHAGKVPGTDQINQPITQAYMKSMNLLTEQMAPGRVLIPEAFLPKDVIRKEWLDPHIVKANGDKHATMGNIAISFDSAKTNSLAMLSGDVRPYLKHVQDTTPAEDDLGYGLAYPGALHDERLLPQNQIDSLKADGKLFDPMDAIDKLEANLKAQGKTLDVDTAMAHLKKELESDKLVNFANRAVGDDYLKMLGDSPEAVAQSVALTYSGSEIPAVYYRVLAGAGNNVDFALQQTRLRLQKQLEAGESLNFRKAFDGRDLARGGVDESIWKQRIAEKWQPIEMTRALNKLWSDSPTMRSRRPKVLPNEDASIGVFARRVPEEDARGMLQVFNVSKEPKTVRIPKSEIADALGPNWLQNKSVDDVLGSTMSGRKQSVDMRIEGDHVVLKLAPSQTVFLQPPKPGLRERANVVRGNVANVATRVETSVRNRTQRGTTPGKN